jgi:hypothetical protein
MWKQLTVFSQISDNEHVAYTSSEVLVILKKEGNPAAGDNTDEPGEQ